MQSNMPYGTISVHEAHDAPRVMSGKEMLLGNAYRPWPARVTSVRDLTANENKAEEFLKRVKASNFAEYLAGQKKNIQRDVAEKLLKKASESQTRLKVQIAELQLLLQNGRNFVEFNLNILTRTSASETYGAGAQRDSQRTRRMFDANI